MKNLKAIIIFFLVAGLCFSCLEEQGLTPTLTDAQLIEAIKSSSNKQSVDATSLPSGSMTSIEQNLSEQFLATAQLAPELGYEITLRNKQGTTAGKANFAYFDLEGRELEENLEGEAEEFDEDECFSIVFPITFNMPDGSTHTINNDTDWDIIEQWYDSNPESDKEPTLIFPIEVLLINISDSTLTINNNDQLGELEELCYGDEWEDEDYDCFEFVLPITVTLPDSSQVTITTDSDWDKVEDWFDANPNVIEDYSLLFPFNVELEDGSVITIENEERLEQLMEECYEHHMEEEYFDFVYPITLTMPDNSTLKLEKEEDWDKVEQWYDANPNSEQDPSFVFPISIKVEDGEIIAIKNQQEWEEVEERFCPDEYEDDCFDLALPVTFTMPDNTTITVSQDQDWDLLDAWYDANPNVDTDPSPVFPITVILDDDSQKTLSTEQELRDLEDSCHE